MKEVHTLLHVVGFICNSNISLLLCYERNRLSIESFVYRCCVMGGIVCLSLLRYGRNRFRCCVMGGIVCLSLLRYGRNRLSIVAALWEESFVYCCCLLTLVERKLLPRFRIPKNRAVCLLGGVQLQDQIRYTCI